ncbi:hypothetical protein RhiirA5_301369 [Rhizophagus irregularis]|uniref:Uncharacterized protein n=2 Tax=Rhizophagus irregularis TaxID=588596 RepID=A0A2N0NTY1_9GLOM|nr:hypothetical protein GLOIN_2v1466169 [Rhizophagus irregularis DAOM 181602=DAOM 197198]PKB98034.1 hypothetical protein RhiirA5_301369 [Rhizophagus irregularis]POG60792.1 hypothetical protein GLOIN_2v1466169 [Rhizophagus irregularis DAOM 181602=DAOM 197198]GET61821.1 hypothetical protein GLOIN_2v1466169 [Rhizophagus irregularis DAOM 181602=DAOM 197198]|eukprot:XP_025167658.1 hypothetical protein GLOIN_2v1466169 [Rhizophagus irregularis DAOM 181602=DAOM 197198]
MAIFIKHFIPTINGQYLPSTQIWAAAVQEVYNFYKQHSLPWLWVYPWNERYSADRCFYGFGQEAVISFYF